ncbi:aspartate-semialdehyde dehydrogenase, partial [Francisella tularensis subsp. holarctica]|nr:aspartate-semialdehyde dehydrogenase [Francisella tularensis subsp. holarctica]
MYRMIESKDFDCILTTFFSTSQVRQLPTGFMQQYGALQDDYSIDQLSSMDILLICQGGEYTK